MPPKKHSLLVRISGLVIVTLIAGLLIGPPLRQKRTERRVRAMLLAVQEGLQRYHVSEELYPKRMMSGQELVRLLSDSEFLDESIVNPWTGGDYVKDAKVDCLRYRTNNLAETYELIVYFPGTDEVQFRLDSTEHQSLE